MTEEKREVLYRVLEKLGVERVQYAMTHTCKPRYYNLGWDNCFLTQAVGGWPKLVDLMRKHSRTGTKVTEPWAIALEFGISFNDVCSVIGMFDWNVNNLSSVNGINAARTFFEAVDVWLFNRGVPTHYNLLGDIQV